MDDKRKSKDQLIRELTELRVENESLKRQPVNSEKTLLSLSGKKIAEEYSTSDLSLIQTLVDLLHSFIFVKDKESRFLYANDSCARYMGASSFQELIGKTDADFYPAPEAARFRIDELEVLAGIPMINKEDIRVFPDGKRQTFLTSKVPLRSSDGKIIGLVGNSLDITELKLAEDKLRSSEEWFRNLFEQSSDGIFYSTITGRIITVNTSFAEMHGYSIDEILKMNIDDLDCPESKKLFAERLDRILKGEKLSFEVEHFHKEGHKIPLEVTAGKVMVGSAIYIMASYRDISQRKLAEESKKISEENFRILFEENPLPTVLSEIPTGKITFVNKQCASLLRMNPVDILGHTPKDLGLLDNPEDQEKLTNMVIRQGFVDNLELEKVLPDGKKRTDLISMRLVLINGIPHCLTVILDISDRKKIEEALSFSEEKFSKAFLSSPDSITISSLNTGVLLEVNQGFEGMFGFSRLEAIGNSTLDLKMYADPGGRDKFVKILRLNGNVRNLELQGRRKSGELFIGLLSAEIIDINEEQCIVSTVRDITDHKLMEEKIIESEAYYRTLVDVSPDGVSVVDINGNLIYASRKMFEIFAIPPDEDVLGKSILAWVTPEYRKIVVERVQGLLKGIEKPGIMEYKLLKHNKVSFWAELLSSPIPDANGNLSELLVVCRDITERKEAEDELLRAKKKAEQSDRLKSSFLANMSHEIRTPMNGILGFAELLKDRRLTSEEQTEYLNIIEKSGSRMLNILNDLIDISRIESGQMNVLISPCNINQEMELLYDFFKPDASLKGLHMLLKNDPDNTVTLIRTDKEKLNSVLSNLIRNAIKFTNDGTIEFGYKVKEKFLEFYVKDSGVGISPEIKDLIFERFRQGSESLARNYEGAGLGLSISKSFVEMLGGNIRTESTPGKGSVFYFTIPYDILAEQKTDIKNNNSERSNNDLPGKLKILIAEDDEPSMMLISNIIRNFGKEIIKASNGKEAVEYCRKNKDIDLILMDIKMPVLDGYEATRQIRQFNSDVVIIAQTAYAQLGDSEKALNAGCDDYISKPISKAGLVELINKYFQD